MNNAVWPDPLQLLEIRDAVNKKRPTVRIDDRLFNIRYEDKEFFISPQHGFAPSGYFLYHTAFTELES